MVYRYLADAVVLVHFAFVLFVVGGGLLALRWRRASWLHLPAALWGALIEFGGWICPLTPLENRFRELAGEQGYSGGFVEHHMLGLLYPEGLTREVQVALGVAVLAINGLVYGGLLARHAARRRRSRASQRKGAAGP